MRLSKNLKSTIILILILFTLYAWGYIANERDTKHLKHKLEQQNCNLEIEGYRFGLTKNEFDRLYVGIADSMKYSRQLGYVDNGRVIKSFHGLLVRQTQFVFANNVFSRTVNRTDFFTGIVFNLDNVTDKDIMFLKSEFGNLSKWTKKERFDEKEKLVYSYQWVDINECIYITLIYKATKKKAAIDFNIHEDIIRY